MRSKTKLIKNAHTIVTMNTSRQRYSNGDIYIEGNRIIEIGVGLSRKADEVIDARNKLVIPGLVNTHHHMYQTLQRNIPLMQDEELFPWLKHLYEVWRNITPEAVYVSTQVAVGELLKTGCTTTTDLFYVFPRDIPGNLIDMQIEAAAKLGVRFEPCRGSMSLGVSKGGLPPDDVVQSEEEILQDSERLINKHHDPRPLSMLRISLAPCSPFSVSRESLVETARFARRKGVRLHTHLAETKDEERYCLERFGLRPLAYMESVEWVGPDVWYAHAVHLNEEECRKLAATGSKVAHCPTSNMRLASGAAPIPRMLELGVDVGLAVDGSASNDTSDMLGELRTCLLLHRLTSGVGSMSAEKVMEMGTIGGAAILGRDDIGRLEVGKAADMALINLNVLGYAGALSDPLAAIVFSGDSHIVDTTIVNGEIVVRDSHLVNVDEEKLVEEANKLSTEMLEKAMRFTGLNYYACAV
ncbi:MAG: 8-oxoguanine deaminase [Chloroflexi bacterium]|nr:8-oxoguanine deaminase [Chloroflexota bacterium]MCL5074435.1 8-oxoguanine deaminase [Chloroflexota bacterium]